MNHSGQVLFSPMSWQAACLCGWTSRWPTVAEANEALRQHVESLT